MAGEVIKKEFPLNYKNKYEICTEPTKDEQTAKWEVIGAGISTVDPAFEDETDDTSYYDGQGFGSETVTGVKASLTFSGHRQLGDPAQDYVIGMAFEVGAKRETKLRWTQTDGKQITGDVTISGIKGTGGDANAKQDFEFKASFNGKPKVTTTP
jgi:hypothetical protein